MRASDLYRLMTWLSPSFPVGSFSYSHGLETAIDDGKIGDREELVAWIATLLRHGAGRTDAVLLHAAWEAAERDDRTELFRVASVGAVLVPTAEIAHQTAAQGAAFMAAAGDAWPAPLLEQLVDDCSRVVFPVAVGVASAAHGVPVDLTTTAYLTEFAANLVSAGMRLIPLGQRDGQRAIAALEPVVELTRLSSANLTVDTVGGATPTADLTSMRHETQYTRLFRS